MAYQSSKISEGLSKAGDEIGRTVTDLTDRLGPSGRQAVERGREYGEQAQSMARTAIHERPVAVIVVAVLFGFALGALWR